MNRAARAPSHSEMRPDTDGNSSESIGIEQILLEGRIAAEREGIMTRPAAFQPAKTSNGAVNGNHGPNEVREDKVMANTCKDGR